MDLEHDPEKWVPVFRKDHAQIKEIEWDDDSKKSHRALSVFRFEYLQGIKQEFWILLADAVTDPGKAPFADVRNQRHGP
jgi:hypothetical protein